MNSAEVVAVYPNRIRIAVHSMSDLGDGQPVELGSYLQISDIHENSIIAIIESYAIELRPTRPNPDGSDRDKVYVIDAVPLGMLDTEGSFERGGGKIVI